MLELGQGGSRHLLVINDVLAGGGDDVASCGGHDSLDGGHQPGEGEAVAIEGVDIPLAFSPLLYSYNALDLATPHAGLTSPAHVFPKLPVPGSVPPPQLLHLPSCYSLVPPIPGRQLPTLGYEHRVIFLPGHQGGHPGVRQC